MHLDSRSRRTLRPGTGQRGGPLGYLAGLDGVRGLAVALVLLYHGNVAQLPGGHLGVTMFFTLSGFLITSLLLLEQDRTGRVSLRRFWGRRARRLIPALLLCFPLVAVVVSLSGQTPGRGLMGDAAAGALWVANWRFIFEHQSYADLFSLPSPFQHFWSLAVEEQYYLVFPVVAAVLLRRAGRRTLALLLAQLVVVSTALCAVLAAHSVTIGRAYYGTDSRIAEILVGALLALAFVQDGRMRTVSRGVRRGLDAAAVGAAILLAGLVATLGTGDPRLFRGGLLLAALSTAVIIAAAIQPGSVVGRLLSFPPLVWLGVISYGVYLFHWPLFLLLTEHKTGLSGAPLLGLRIASTVALAAVSYYVVEAPIRHRVRITPVAGTASWAVGALAGVLAIGVAAGVIQLPGSQRGPGAVAASGTTSAGSGSGAAPSHVAPSRAAHRSGGAASTGQPTTSAVPVTRSAQPQRKFGGLPTELAPKKGVDYTQAPPLPNVPVGAVKVAVIGDSVGNNLGEGLVNWAGSRTDVAVYNLAIPGCPVSRGGQRRVDPEYIFEIPSWCSWWGDPSSPRYQALTTFAPNVIVMEDGINEAFDRRLPSWSGWEKPGNPQFDQWLVSEYQTFNNTFTNMGAKMIFANAPCADWEISFASDIPDGDQRVDNLNTDYPRVLNMNNADLFAEVCPNGQFSQTVDGVPNARPDGIHFIPDAADALARDWLGPLTLRTARGSLVGVSP